MLIIVIVVLAMLTTAAVQQLLPSFGLNTGNVGIGKWDGFIISHRGLIKIPSYRSALP